MIGWHVPEASLASFEARDSTGISNATLGILAHHAHRLKLWDVPPKLSETCHPSSQGSATQVLRDVPRKILSISPPQAGIEFEFLGGGFDFISEALGVERVAGGGTQLREVVGPELVERFHQSFAKVLAQH